MELVSPRVPGGGVTAAAALMGRQGLREGPAGLWILYEAWPGGREGGRLEEEERLVVAKEVGQMQKRES